ncbi:MAG: thiamine ABC transporter substrate-binding protein [SAR324 cluster bacterium]|nr:thiamine ABC transporter substrate-binding protein [SAR324 cluster bacterium]
MNKIAIFLAALGLNLLYSAALASNLTIYTYDSFNSEWGPGPVVFKQFEKQCQCTLKIVALGDSGLMLNRIILEKKNPQADIFLGLNNSQLGKALSADIFVSYRSPNLADVNEEHWLDPQNRVTPFDYGFLAFVYDSEKIAEPPQSLQDLLKEEFKGKIVIEDPRTSSPGLTFLHWTISAFGEEGYLDYWEKLNPNLLAITSGWSAAYGMFTKGEAPLVLSYATSPAYHLEHEKTDRFRAALFARGHYKQVEGAGIVKGSRNPAMARQFIDYMLSSEFQKEIPLKNWMFPVAKSQELPKSFSLAIHPDAVKSLDDRLILEKNSSWLKQWARRLGN